MIAKPLITNIQRECVYDGPGIRTTVFLKGCSLSCPWCCNPENIRSSKESFFDKQLCDSFRGKSNICRNCEKNGGDDSSEYCPFHATQSVGEYIPQEQLVETLLLDKPLYIMSGGGVTFSGGEPLLFMEYLENVIKSLKVCRINTIAETTLFPGNFDLLDQVFLFDGFIVDLKLQPELKLHDIEYLERVDENIKKLSDLILTYRLVFTDSMLAYSGEVISRLKELRIDRIELLQCHDLAKKKYLKLGKEIIYPKSDQKKMMRFSENLKNCGLIVKELFI